MRGLYFGRRRINHLTFEQVSPLFLGHSLARVGNHNVYISLFHHTGTKRNAAVSFGKLACIVYQRVNHKERKGAIGLNNLGCWLYHKSHPFAVKPHSAFPNDIEEGLQSHTFHVQT